MKIYCHEPKMKITNSRIHNTIDNPITVDGNGEVGNLDILELH